MRCGTSIALVCLLAGSGTAAAQQPNALGPPSTVAGSAASPSLPTTLPVAQSGPALGPPPRVDPAPPSPSGPAIGPPPKQEVAPIVWTPYGQQPPYTPPPYAAPGYAPLALPPIDEDACARNPRVWVGVEALIWWTRSQPLSVPVITTGPASQGANAGNLGAAGTVSLNGPLDLGVTGGVRFSAGGWFDVGHNFGLDGSIFFLGRQTAGFGAFDRSGNGSFVINEPLLGTPPFSTQVSAPGTDTGGTAVNAGSRFGGGDVNFLVNLYRTDRWSITLLAGYRYLELDESLAIDANAHMFIPTMFLDPQGNTLVTAPAGSTILVFDRFSTRNQFNGGQLGAEFQYLWGRWSVNSVAKLGIGATHEVITIDGSTLVLPVGGAPVPVLGGNFATLQAGRFSHDTFALAPEFQLTLGYQITPYLRATLGYDFLYLSHVVRPGNQIDNTYDGVAHPGVPFSSSGYWAQGINLGLRFTY